MDEIDYRLTVELQENPRIANTKLGKLLGISEATVRRRIENLVSSGTITFTAVPDPFKVGYNTQAFIRVTAELSQIQAVAERLVNYPEVRYASFCLGTNDILIRVFFRSTLQLSDFITKELGKIPGIKKTETMMQLRILKRNLAWLKGLPANNFTNKRRNRQQTQKYIKVVS